MKWFSSFPFILFPWVMKDINHAWKALELINLMMITWKKGRRICLSSIGGTSVCFVLVLSAMVVVYVQDFVN